MAAFSTAAFTRRRIVGGALYGTGLSLLPYAARAQTWPSRPIRVVSSQAPGSGNDAIARAYAEYTARVLDSPVVVENRSGAGGMIAGQYVASQPPDGHTLLLIGNSQLAQASVLYKKPLIDTSKDLTPVAGFAAGTSPMCVHKDVPARNLKELVQLARTRPVSVGNFAIGSTWHLVLEQLQKDTGAKFTIVHYKGTGPMVQDLMGGSIEVAAGSFVGMNPGIQSGHFRPIALISPSQTKQFPGLPTMRDEGFTGPAYQDLVEAYMLLAPRNLPPAILARLGAIAKDSATKAEPMKNIFKMLGVEVDPVLTGTELQENYITRAWPTFQRLTRELGIEPQ